MEKAGFSIRARPIQGGGDPGPGYVLVDGVPELRGLLAGVLGCGSRNAAGSATASVRW
jgi:hypothetical protein